MLRVICENPGRKKKSPITKAAKNWQADSKTMRPKVGLKKPGKREITYPWAIYDVEK